MMIYRQGIRRIGKPYQLAFNGFLAIPNNIKMKIRPDIRYITIEKYIFLAISYKTNEKSNINKFKGTIYF